MAMDVANMSMSMDGLHLDFLPAKGMDARVGQVHHLSPITADCGATEQAGW